MIEFYKTFFRKEWRWRIKAKNNKTIASSSEGFRNRQDCEHNLKITGEAIKEYNKKTL